MLVTKILSSSASKRKKETLSQATDFGPFIQRPDPHSHAICFIFSHSLSLHAAAAADGGFALTVRTHRIFLTLSRAISKNKADSTLIGYLLTVLRYVDTSF